MISQRPTMTQRASTLDANNNAGNISLDELKDIKDRLKLNEIKIDDHDSKIQLILRSRKAGGNGTNSKQANNNEDTSTGIDIGEIIALLD